MLQQPRTSCTSGRLGAATTDVPLSVKLLHLRLNSLSVMSFRDTPCFVFGCTR